MNRPHIARLIKELHHALEAASSVADLDVNQGFYSIQGMSGKKYRYFINNLIRGLSSCFDVSYLEVGVWQGSTFCSAIHNNKVRAVAIDNWSEFQGPKDTFLHNVHNFMTPGADATFYESDFRKMDFTSIGKFDIYLFDGPHETIDHYDSLAIAHPALNDQFIFIVDDWNYGNVREGTFEAVEKMNLEVLYSFEIRTTMDESHAKNAWKWSDWHNGYYFAVLSKVPVRERKFQPRASDCP